VPNLWQDSFSLTGVSINGTPTTTYSLDGQRLDIALSSFTKPEEVLTINIQYTLSLPFAEQEDPGVSRPRIYGYTKRQLNLTNWYPFVVPYINGNGFCMNRFMANILFMTLPIMRSISSFRPGPARSSPRRSLNRSRLYPHTITAARTFAPPGREFKSQPGLGMLLSSYYFLFWSGRQALQSARRLWVYSLRYGPHIKRSREWAIS
jgi:hypothetical protein